MAGNERGLLGSPGVYGERKYIGSNGWPFVGFDNTATPLPEGTNLGDGYIPPNENPTRNPNTGNPWQGG